MEDINKIQWPGWETVRMIGRGSFGSVYEIKRTVLGGGEEFVAMKVISIPQTDSDLETLRDEGYDNATIKTIFKEHLESIVKEYSTMKTLNRCNNIVYCEDYQYIEHEDGLGWDIFIKMELLTPLMKSLPEHIDDETVIKIGIDMCSALEFCKDQNIAHRDIKPQNIFKSKYGEYKLGDFGIAKTVEKTTGGTKIGTYDYMAPEVYNNKPYGSSADIYSLGLVLYWLLNNRRSPFLPQPPEVPTSKMKEDARLRRFTGNKLPTPVNGSDKLQKIVLKACAFNESDRFNSATEMKNALLSLFENDEPLPLPPPPSPVPPPPPPHISPKKLLYIVASVVVVIIAAIAGFSISNNKDNVDVAGTTEAMSVSDEVTEKESTTTEVTTIVEKSTEETTEESTTKKTTESTTLDSGKLYRPAENKFCNQYKRYVSGYFEGQKYAKMRFGPSKSKFDVVGKISNGKIVTVQTKSVDGWTLIDYEGVEGWVRTDFLFSTYDECFSTKQITTTKPTTTKPTTTKPTTTKPTTTKPTTTVPTTTVPVSISSIAIKSSPSKLSYLLGESLDSTGLVLTITYSNGTTESVSTGYTCYPTTFDSCGTQKITVSYKGKTTSFSVRVSNFIVSIHPGAGKIG